MPSRDLSIIRRGINRLNDLAASRQDNPALKAIKDTVAAIQGRGPKPDLQKPEPIENTAAMGKTDKPAFFGIHAPTIY